ncbi:MAG: hypothetical protein ACKO0M_12825 [Cyanobium sp.]
MAFTNSHRPAAPQITASGTPACRSRAYTETGHQLEKLEFALAVAVTRGDTARIEELRHRIAELGGNREEPGT